MPSINNSAFILNADSSVMADDNCKSFFERGAFVSGAMSKSFGVTFE